MLLLVLNTIQMEHLDQNPPAKEQRVMKQPMMEIPEFSKCVFQTEKIISLPSIRTLANPRALFIQLRFSAE